MKKVVSVGLSLLLLYHTLAYVLVCIGAWWQAEHDLSEKLLVYRSVDSLVEFQIALKSKPDALTKTTLDGFGYHGHYYDVVSLEVRGDTLHIAGLESESRSFWQSDLLSFLNDHIAGATESHEKTNQFLKFLLKEYSPNSHRPFTFAFPHWRDAVRIPGLSVWVPTRTLPVYSPPARVRSEISGRLVALSPSLSSR